MYLLDPAKRCWVLCDRFVLVMCLFIRPSKALLGLVPPVCVSYLFVYLFIWLVRKLFFQNATSPTIMNGFF